MNSIDIHFYESGLRNVLRNSNKNNSEFNIEIKHSKNKNNSNIINFKVAPHIENRKNYLDDHCIWFSININDKKLYKVDLRKCSLLSGTEILFILEKIAKIFRLSKICLEDNSHISIISKTNETYDIFLRYMYILSTGISWYNKFGYISKNFEEEKEHNRKIMEIPLSDYMSLILKENINTFETQFKKEFFIIKEQYFIQNLQNLHKLQKRRVNEIKSIIKKNYQINNNKLSNLTFVTDDILYEAIKKLNKYDENIENINSKHHKFMTYLESPNLLNYIKPEFTISYIIIKFREKIERRNIRLDNNELEFINYILDESNDIIQYDSNLVKIIATNL